MCGSKFLRGVNGVRGFPGLLLALVLAQTAAAQEGQGNWLAALAEEADATEQKTPKGVEHVAPSKWEKPIPLTFNIFYVLASDYVFRGINFSEYPGEGREKPNQQLSANVEADTGRFGSVGATFWFEWFAGQEHQTPWSSSHLQEVDYTAYWRYSAAPLATTFETGWIAYTFPPLHRAGTRAAGVSEDAWTTYEWYAKLSYDDSKLFGTSVPVLNPYVYYGLDTDQGDCGSWIELGISHPFALGDVESLKDTPIVKNVTLTPSLVLGIDHRYLDKFDVFGDGTEQEATRLANLLYGLEAMYDLGKALNMPSQYGTLKVGGFLNFSQALRDDLIHNEFYGGMKVIYGW